MLEKDIDEWTISDLQKVHNHFGENIICFSGGNGDSGAGNSPENVSEATILMPARSVKCQVVIEGELTGQGDEHQWVAYRKDGNLYVSERLDAPKDEALHRVGKIELVLRHSGSYTVAVCDDNSDLADSIGDFLRAFGFSPSVFYTVNDVEKAMADKAFDAFVLDWSISGQTSEALIRLIRLAKSPTVPIFLITGQLNQGLSTESEIAEVVRKYRVVPRDKPVRPSILAAEILTAIQFSSDGEKSRP